MPLVCVLGSGIIGLSAAKSLVDAGYDVVVVARDMPGDPGGLAWSSPSAGAVIYPTSAGKDEAQQFETEAYKQFWALAHQDPTSGATIVPVTEYFENSKSYNEDSQAWYMKVKPYYRRVPSNELPEGMVLGVTLTTIVVNPIVYLPWLQNKLEAKGVKFIRHTATALDEVLSMTQASVLVNASGLGAGKLCNDVAVVPIRGQAVYVRNKPGWGQILLRQGSEYTYVIPRFHDGGILMGGVRQEGVLHEEADPTVREDILRRANLIAQGAFDDVNIHTDVEDIVGFRPGRKGGFRLEAEGTNVVHAYGFDGVGYVVSFGTAKTVTRLVKQLLAPSAKL